MKRLTYISGTNIRGFDFQYPLKPVTAFCAPNEQGKTAVLDAIRLALLGFLPRLGRQNEATMKLASQHNLELSVSLNVTDDQDELVNTRTWRRAPNGDLKKTETCQIKDIPAVLFDVREWLGLTHKKRLEMIFERIGKTDIKVDETDILRKLGEIEVLPIAEGKAAVTDLNTFVNKSLQRRKQAKQNGLDWLTSLVKELDDQKKIHAARAEQLGAQVSALRPAGPTPKSVAAKIEQTSAEIKTVCEQVARIEGVRQAIELSVIRRKQLEALVLVQVDPQEIKKLEQTKLSLTTRSDAIQVDVKEWERKLDAKLRDHQKIQAALESAFGQQNKLKSQIEDIDELPCCPTCKSKKSGWQQQWRESLTSESETLESEITKLTTSSKAITEEGKTIRARLDEATKLAEKKVQLQTERETILTQIKSLKEKLDVRLRAEQELARMTETAGQVDLAELEGLKKKADGLSRERDDLLKAQAEFDRFEVDRAKSSSSEKNLIAEQTRVEVFKRGSVLIVEEQEKLLGQAFQSILVHARRFTDDILLGPLGYRDGELGMETEKGWVSHETFSGRGQALAYIGLSVALAQSSPIKIVILDEAGIFDKPTKIKVVNRLLALAAEGVIDGAFLADPDAEDYSAVTNKEFGLTRMGQG